MSKTFKQEHISHRNTDISACVFVQTTHFFFPFSLNAFELMKVYDKWKEFVRIGLLSGAGVYLDTIMSRKLQYNSPLD